MQRNWQHRPPKGWREARQAASDTIFYMSNAPEFTEWRGGMLVAKIEHEFDCLLTYLIMIREEFGMKKRKGNKAVWKGFLDYNLTGEDRDKFLAWDFEDQEVWGAVADLCFDGHKVSMSYNKQNDSYVCSITAVMDTCSMPGFTLSSWGNTPYQAARLSAFKHLILADGDWAALKDSVTGGFG